MAIGSAKAQIIPPLPGAVEPGRDRPLPEAPVQPDFDFTIEAPQRSPLPRAVDEVHFHLNDIRIVGAVTLPPARFTHLYANLIGKDVTLADIFNIGDAIEADYRAAGYLLTRAFVPPQRVDNGVFTINVVEGYVASSNVDGGSMATQDRVKTYLKPVLADKPLKLATMERALLLANDLPGVAAAGVLRPSPDTPGASDLVVTLATEPVSAGLSISNRGSHYAGLWTLTGDFIFNALFGGDNQLAGNVVTTPSSFNERLGGQLRYRQALGTGGLTGSLVATAVHGEPGSTLQAFNVLTDSWAVGPRLSYPLKRTRAETLLLDAGVTFQEARVNVLGQPLSHDKWRVADIALSYAGGGITGGTLTATLDLAKGLDTAGATPAGSPELSRVGADPEFLKVTATVHHTSIISGPFSLALAAQGQYAATPVVVGEAISFGATQIGRGYDSGAITGDNGLGGSVELRYDRRTPQSWLQALEPYIFFDAAQVWSRNVTADLNRSISSIGAGIRLSFMHDIVADLELAQTLQAVPGSDSGKQATKVFLDAAVRF